jgi:hypothetical protein
MFDTNGNNTYGGVVYNPQNGQYQQKQTSTLTQEEYNRLMKQENRFSLALTETEVLRGLCNHRSLDGMKDMLTQDPDGTVRCEVCGYRFEPVDPSMTEEDVKESVKLITDILQTIKLLFIDMPVSASREFFQIIPLLEKVPDLFKLAVSNFSKHENVNAWGYRGQNMGTMNLFNMLSGALNGGMPMYGQPQYQQPFQQQPMNNGYYGAFGTQVPPMNAPVGAQAPMGNPAMMGGYNPQTVGFQYGQPQPQMQYPMDPNMAAQQAGVPVQTPTTATTDGKEVTVNTQLKA